MRAKLCIFCPASHVLCSVSSLVTTLQQRQDGHDVSFASSIRKEIETLRKQLDKPESLNVKDATAPPPAVVPTSGPDGEFAALLRALRVGTAEDGVEPDSAWAKLVRSFTGARPTGATSTVPLDKF